MRAAGTSGSGKRWAWQDLRGAAATNPSSTVLTHVDCESSGPMHRAHGGLGDGLQERVVFVDRGICRPTPVPIGCFGAGGSGPSAYGDPAVLAKLHRMRRAPSLPRKCAGSKTARCAREAAVPWLHGNGVTWCRGQELAVARRHRAHGRLW